jgi:hypothetical protein
MTIQVNPLPTVEEVLESGIFAAFFIQYPMFDAFVWVESALEGFEQLWDGIPTTLYMRTVVERMNGLETDYEEVESWEHDALNESTTLIMNKYGFARVAEMDEIAKQYSLKKPCKACPFAIESTFTGLREGRATEIIDGLLSYEAGTFPCHKTTHKGEEWTERRHCAGAMAVTLKAGGMPLVVIAAMQAGMIQADHYNEAKPLTLEYNELEIGNE